MQPGETITSGNTPTEPEKTTQHTEQAPQEPPQEQASTQGEPVADGTDSQALQEPGWHFNADDDQAYMQTAVEASAPVGWTASEYVAHDKNAGWYLLVVLGAAGLGAAIYAISRDKVSPVVVLIFGIALAAFGARKPRVLDYAIDGIGVHIGQRVYPYGMFKSFSVIQEDATRSILLMPLQRFNLPISIYYDPADEDKIIESLSAYLPHEDRKVGMLDNFMRKIRF